MNKNIKNNKGVILILTLFILSGILIITLTAADLVLAGIRMNRLAGYSSLAFFASEAGLERALWEARKNPSFSLPNEAEVKPVFSLIHLDNDSAYLVDYASSSPPLVSAPKVIFTSIGNYLGTKRSVESSYELQ